MILRFFFIFIPIWAAIGVVAFFAYLCNHGHVFTAALIATALFSLYVSSAIPEDYYQ